MPRLDFTAQILVEHRLEEKVIFVINEGDFAGARQFESGEETAESATDDHDFRLSPGHLIQLSDSKRTQMLPDKTALDTHICRARRGLQSPN